MKYLVHDYFEETVRRLPDKTAFLDPDGSVTFSRLYEGARRTASKTAWSFSSSTGRFSS